MAPPHHAMQLQIGAVKTTPMPQIDAVSYQTIMPTWVQPFRPCMDCQRVSSPPLASVPSQCEGPSQSRLSSSSDHRAIARVLAGSRERSRSVEGEGRRQEGVRRPMPKSHHPPPGAMNRSNTPFKTSLGRREHSADDRVDHPCAATRPAAGCTRDVNAYPGFGAGGGAIRERGGACLFGADAAAVAGVLAPSGRARPAPSRSPARPAPPARRLEQRAPVRDKSPGQYLSRTRPYENFLREAWQRSVLSFQFAWAFWMHVSHHATRPLDAVRAGRLSLVCMRA